MATVATVLLPIMATHPPPLRIALALPLLVNPPHVVIHAANLAPPLKAAPNRLLLLPGKNPRVVVAVCDLQRGVLR